MLYLINESKGGRNFSINNDNVLVNWRSIFKTSEDSLTSSIFSLLFYLPVELFWRILCEACYDDVLQKSAGRLLSYDFWPRWLYMDGYREPDVFIQFENFDVIVEAKRWERNQQQGYQWNDEIDAYNENNASGKKVYLLAIGGINDNDKNSSIYKNATIVRCRWGMLLKQILYHYDILLKHSFTSSTDSVTNILRDLILSFRIHGYVTTALLETMPKDIKIGNSLNILNSKKFKIQYSWKKFSSDLLNIQSEKI